MKPVKIEDLKPDDKVVFITYVHSIFDNRVELRDGKALQPNQMVWNFTQAALDACHAELVEE